MTPEPLSSKPVLIVDDEPHAVLSLNLTLKTNLAIKNIKGCNTGREVKTFLEHTEPSLVLLDIGMPRMPGTEVLILIKKKFPSVPVIMVTAEIDLEKAVECMRNGAFDYITKPVNKERLINSVKKALEFRAKDIEVEGLRESITNPLKEVPDAFSHIITQDSKMLSLFKYLEAVSKSEAPILITGETGTGKEMIAKGIHNLCGIKTPFVTCNVAGLDDQLFSDTLFGHVKGAFTGANSNRGGLIERAESGILFLDEIGDLSISSQVKLLRLLQENEYTPLGSDKAKKCNVRVLAATHRDLEHSMREGTFRSDLFFRLNTHKVNLPSLRERLEDLTLLLRYFIDEAAFSQHKSNTPAFHPSIIALLKSYQFPGNIRELKAMVDDAVAQHTSGHLAPVHFAKKIHLPSESIEYDQAVLNSIQDYFESMQTWEPLPCIETMKLILISEAMRRSDNIQAIAGKLLGMSRQGIGQWMKKHGDELCK